MEGRVDTTQQACWLLHTVHEKTFCWVLELLEKVKNTTDEEDKVEFQSQLHDTATICWSTFDVGELIIRTQLLNSPRAIEIFLSCAIIIHNNSPPNLHIFSNNPLNLYIFDNIPLNLPIFSNEPLNLPIITNDPFNLPTFGNWLLLE
ncbi:hypothetical protein J3A83DRAFT_4476151 [Scleroderma citrinum]